MPFTENDTGLQYAQFIISKHDKLMWKADFTLTGHREDVTLRGLNCYFPSAKAHKIFVIIPWKYTSSFVTFKPVI